MKGIALVCILASFVLFLTQSCVTDKSDDIPAELPDGDWSNINVPGIAEEGDWVLLPGMMCALGPWMFSIEGETIYMVADSTVWGLFGEAMSFLMKSEDYGHTWSRMPGLDELGVFETFSIATVGNHIYVCSSEKGVYHSEDGGVTFQALPAIPDTGQGFDHWYWSLDATLDSSGKPVVLACTVHDLGGLWMLSYPYSEWVDLRVGNDDANTTYDIWEASFSPDYTRDGQIVALVSDGQQLRVTFKTSDEDWGESIADAQIPDTETECDLDFTFTEFAFPDDYNAKKPIVYIGAGIYTEHLHRDTQYTDLYRIDGRSAASGSSVTTDLDVGGRNTSTPVVGLAVRGSAESATILAGGIGNIYRSDDGGINWQRAEKPPTGGAVTWIALDPRSGQDSIVYCMSSDSWSCFNPRNAEIPVGEAAFCRSNDDGATWSQLSFISTIIDETLSRALSPGYAKDNTLFMLTRSSSVLTIEFDEDETLYITREPDEPGVTTEFIIVNHLGNPPSERIKIGDEEQGYVAGTGPKVVLDNSNPYISIRALPVLEQPGMQELFEQLRETNPWFVEQYLALCEQPRQAVIYVLDGQVTVSTAEGVEGDDSQGGEVPKISIDGNPGDWQGIEPLAIDPEGDAPSKDEDLRAFYVTNDSEYLYFMVEFCSETPRSVCDLYIDKDLDGQEDITIIVKQDQALHVFAGQPSEDTIIGEGEAAIGTVIEGKVSLDLIGNPKKLGINRIDIVTKVDGSATIPDQWEGSLEVDIIEREGNGGSALNPTLIQFPSTESLWKTTNGGNTWERILTSNLKLLVDGEVVQVGTLESIALSDNFAQDNTLFAYEGGDSTRVWVSTDCGATFTIQQ